MKLIFATGIFPPDIGGPATYVEKLAQELHRRGFGIKVVTYADGGGKKYDFPVARVSRKYPAGLRHFIYFLKLFQLSKGCDVIYAQNVTSAGFPAMLAAKLLKKKFILKVVGDAAWEQKKGYLKTVQGAVARFARRIVVPSLYLKKRVAGWGVATEKIEVIYNAVEPFSEIGLNPEEAKGKIGISGDIILSIGRLAPWKGFGDLIAIMPDLLLQNPDFLLVIIGDGQEKENLKSQILRLKLANSVKLLGKVEHSQIPLYFKAAEMFVLNSGYEGLSHVILEAMQQGVPAIVSNEGGNPELIENRVNGFLAEYGNRDQIKEAILKLWRDKALQEKFRQNSWAKIKDFNWDSLVEKTIKILQ